jgi:primosomal protein N' (replication factor Y)
MRAEVLIPAAGRGARASPSLYSYAVPATLVSSIAAGQLVAVPFGERIVAGIVWALDASEDVDPTPSPFPAAGKESLPTTVGLGEVDSGASETGGACAGKTSLAPTAMRADRDAGDGESASARGRRSGPLRAIAGILLTEPSLLPAQRALAEWIAEYYAAPLGRAARLMLPPGLLPSIRYVLRPTKDASAPEASESALPRDEAIVLAMLRERGELERDAVSQAMGGVRARTAIRALIAAGQVTLGATAPPAYAETRRERLVRLAGTRERREAWRAEARTLLDQLPRPVPRRGITARARRDAGERRAERLLRQLAALDVLEQPVSAGKDGAQSASGETVPRAWRVEELRRLTRATPATLAELEAAGLIAQTEAAVRHDPLAGRAPARTAPLPLSPTQAAALRAILDSEKSGGVFLLHGITGSGKTEIYLQALAATLERGRRGIVLVPEIALTPQAVARFAGRFPGRVALLHSGLSDAERLAEWRRIRSGAADVVVGSRSALFAPVERLGLIVVDEEHEAAYKEERTPTYCAREVAVRLGAIMGARVVLGSATPSTEAYWQARQGAYALVELRERAPTAASVGADEERQPPPLPPVTVVDLRAELRAGRTSILSEPLHAALAETLARGEQAILFLNRRGAASSVMCRECGYAVRCTRCDVAMTYHAAERAMLCHYCGQREPAPATCPVCWSASIRYFGLGTERVEMAVKRQFLTARVLRWDRDTAKTRHAHEELLRAFVERRADVLVGTQMIAKGLDLPGVTLVGVVSADIALFLPDFRASERAFQLLTQVAGRAGRGEQPGRVLVQTFNPDHFCIQAASRHDYIAFVQAELIARERYGYPPFRRFVKLVYEHRDRYSAQIEATALAERVERLIATLPAPGADVVGPAPALLERLRGYYRWQLIVRAADPLPLLRALTPEDLPPGWSVDLDPTNTA